jgi:hypothetical protein
MVVLATMLVNPERPHAEEEEEPESRAQPPSGRAQMFQSRTHDFRREERGRSSMRLGAGSRQDVRPHHNSMTHRPRVEGLDARNGGLAERICRLMKNTRKKHASRWISVGSLRSGALAALHPMVYQCALGWNRFGEESLQKPS